MTSIRTFSDKTALSQAAAEKIVALAGQAIEDRGRFVWALAGGSTPRETYRRLTESPLLEKVDWTRVHVFWGDERCVAPTHADSNFRMADESLLKHVPIPREQVYPALTGGIPAESAAGELDDIADAAAVDYEATVRACLPDGRFDLVLLGLGDDGHTASLFPHTAAIAERERWVTICDPNVRLAPHPPPTPLVQPAVPRISFSASLINRAAYVLFLVAGNAKAKAVKQATHDSSDPSEIPAAAIQPDNGELQWWLDEDAASEC